MDEVDASGEIRAVDEASHSERVQRLLELTDMLPTDGLVGTYGNAADWVFEDVKATWLYGQFSATVLSAYAFCRLQVAGMLRDLPDHPDLPARAGSLEDLALAVVSAGLIDLEAQALLVQLEDRHTLYSRIDLLEYRTQIDRHAVEAEWLGAEQALLGDARLALEASIAVLATRR